MSSQKGKSQLISHTMAPPADAPSLDLESLDKQFQQLDVAKTMPAKMSTSKASDSSRKPSSSSSKRHEASHQPPSRTRSGSTVKGSTKNPPQSSVRETQPPTYNTNISAIKSSHSGAHNLDSKESTVRHSEHRSLSKVYPENQKSHIPSSKQPNERASSSSVYPEDNKSHVSSSSKHTSTQITSSKHGPSHIISQKTTQQTVAGGTSRLKTEHYPVGLMARTYLEGMVPASEHAKHCSSSSHNTYPAATVTAAASRRTLAPSSAHSILVNPEDVTMAARQTQFASLAPADQEEQDNWARNMIERTGSCPEGYGWKRIHDGYQCNGGFHVISDELLSEGMGGVYALHSSAEPDQRWGPYYAEQNNPMIFKYAGPQPKPIFAPDQVAVGKGLLSGGRAAGSLANMGAGVSSRAHGSGLHGSRFGGGRLWSQMGNGYPNSRFPPGSGHHGASHHGSGHHGSMFGPGSSNI